MKNNTIIAFFLLAVLTMACKKQAGTGGSAKVTGSVWVQEWNNSFDVLETEYAGADEDLFLVYGDNAGYDDKITTDYNGKFEIKYLQKGKYKLYTYSKDSTFGSASGRVAMVREFEIKENKSNTELPKFVIFK